jgi:hypothetical protein
MQAMIKSWSMINARSARIPRPIRLQDHVRLPWRFFGRLTASAQAGL